MQKAGRPRGRPANRNLRLDGGTWIFRWARNGKDERKSTGCPKSEVAAARRIRDKWIAERSQERAGVEEIRDSASVGEIIALYLEAESKPYDREKGGSQPGTKRDSASDRVIVKRLADAGLDSSLSADLMDDERLLDLASSMSKDAPLTRRNTFRFLRRVFGWARSHRRQTGVKVNPFDDLDDQASLFSNEVAKKSPPFAREQLRKLYDLLPAHAFRPVRFAAHTGMRWHSEVIQMTWSRVDFERRVYTVDPRWAKKGKEREVPLGDVAVSILKAIRPEKAATDAPVWLNADSGPLKDVRTVFDARVRKVCTAPRPGWRYPGFHSLRRTCGTALGQVTTHDVVAAVLGHGKADVTSGYIHIPLEAQLDALNRAALLIDGDPAEKARPRGLTAKMAGRMAVARTA